MEKGAILMRKLICCMIAAVLVSLAMPLTAVAAPRTVTFTIDRPGYSIGDNFVETGAPALLGAGNVPVVPVYFAAIAMGIPADDMVWFPEFSQALVRAPGGPFSFRAGMGGAELIDGRLYVTYSRFAEGMRIGASFDAAAGVITFTATRSLPGVFEGETVNGVFSGHGTFTYADGSRYVGNFENGVFSGRGTMVWADGTRYEGEWSLGRMHGQGTLTSAGGSVFTGSFVSGVFSGRGTHTYTVNGAIFVYEGDFLNGVAHGNGTLTTPGGVYTGGFVNNMMHGQGTFRYANGDVYVGGFAYDKRDGEGVYTTARGWILTGTWRADRLATPLNWHRAQ